MWTLLRSYATVRPAKGATLRQWMVAEPVDTSKARVLIVEEEAVAQLAARALTKAGCECETSGNGESALSALEQRGADVVLCAVHVNGTDGLDFLRKVHSKRPDVPVVMLTGDPSVSTAVAAMRQGAFDYVTKPLDDEELAAIVARALEMTSLRRENRRLRQQLDVASTAAGFIAESAQTRQLVAMIRRVAPSRSTALIEGESGTGKELVARMLHYWSNRAEGPFIAVNCKAFADGVVESELFGHEKGSFTGAIAARAGCFERASNGTLFLDEIAEAGPDFQAKLLRVLEDGEVLRVGASKPRKVDVRIVAASNRVLRKEVAENQFRADLYFRLNVIPVRIPPLRERPEDILPLARHFLAFYSAEAGRPITLSHEAERALNGYSWPGNVRELENVIERSIVMSGAEVLTPDAFALDPIVTPDQVRAEPSPLHEDTVDPVAAVAGAGTSKADESLQECLDRAAAAKIKDALEAAKGNRAVAASALGVDRTTLYRLMKRLGLSET
jgi:two-component system, NtrC family, response regulator AtoC